MNLRLATRGWMPRTWMNDLLVPWVAIASDAVRRSLEASHRGTGPDHLLAIHLKLEGRNQRVPHLQGVQRDERGVFSCRDVGSPASEGSSPIHAGARDGGEDGSPG